MKSFLLNSLAELQEEMNTKDLYPGNQFLLLQNQHAAEHYHSSPECLASL